MPMSYKPAAKGRDIKPPSFPSPGNNSFLGDVLTSGPPADKQLSAGFFKQEAGEPLVATYTYDEMKLILEVEGEFTLTDETGFKVSVAPGDVLYILKGATVTFATTGYGYAFYTALRPEVNLAA